MRLSWPLVDAAGMRELDRHTIEDLHVAGDVLMESAGRAIVERVLARRAQLPASSAFEAFVVCGAGNNGGDGFVAARHLHLLGVRVRVALIGNPDRISGDAAANLARLRALEVPLEDPGWEGPRAGVLVDAIFGTGLTRDVTGEYAEAIGRIATCRERGIYVIAADLPSGLHADTGASLGVTVEADETVTMGLPKIGLCLEPGRSLAGHVHVARIGICDTAPAATPRAERWTDVGAARALPARPSAGHKGSFGHVLIVAGSVGKTGAAALAARGALRAGSGLVTVACPESLNPILEIKLTEAMTVPVAETPAQGFSVRSRETILALAEERDVVVMGPGVGLDGETAALMRDLAMRIPRPLVLDADGLNALAGPPDFLAELKNRPAESVLTPHPGEASRLLGISAQEINRDRVGAARALAERGRATVVLKGRASVIADANGRVVINPTGGPALATGGTGDVLAGIIGALLAQGLDGWQAAALGVYVHGQAADRLSARCGASGLAALELAEEIPATCEALRAIARASEQEDEGGRSGRREPQHGGGLLFSF